MRITFIGLGYEQLGISQLSAILKTHGHQVQLAYTASLFHDRYNIEIPGLARFFNEDNHLLREIEKQNPQLLCFSALTSTYQWMLQIAQKAKAENPTIKVVFGGVHASAVPHLLIQQPAIDYVVVGEAEEALPLIALHAEKKGTDVPIPNTRYKTKKGQIIMGIQKAFYQDLDSLPFYDKILWEEHIRIPDMYLTMASRGCPYRCTFCFNNFFAKLPEEKGGKYVRLRSPQHMMEELRFAKQRYNMQWVDFEDDVFTTNKKWLEEFLSLYKKEIKRPFKMLTHPRYMDADIAVWLKEAGCEWVQMGVQSMDENYKKDNLLRYEREDDIEQALDLMNVHKLNVKVDHMFGLPGEPVAAQETALKVYQEHTPARIQTFWTCYLPGTQMMNEAVANGSLTTEQANRINEGIEFYFFRNTENVKDKNLMKLYKAYEVAYRLMPGLPARWRKHLTPKVAGYLPGVLTRPFSVVTDMLINFARGNPDFGWYAKHNLHQLLNFLLRKTGLPPRKPRLYNKDIHSIRPTTSVDLTSFRTPDKQLENTTTLAH